MSINDKEAHAMCYGCEQMNPLMTYQNIDQESGK